VCGLHPSDTGLERVTGFYEHHNYPFGSIMFLSFWATGSFSRRTRLLGVSSTPKTLKFCVINCNKSQGSIKGKECLNFSRRTVMHGV
jgi:hypothetical protein